MGERRKKTSKSNVSAPQKGGVKYSEREKAKRTQAASDRGQVGGEAEEDAKEMGERGEK